jgi:hypothetical protein
MENNSPVFRVAAVVQAGAKYEPYESRGVTTLLRVYSNLVIEIEYVGLDNTVSGIRNMSR